MLAPYIQNYQTRKWKTYKMPALDQSSWPKMTDVTKEEVFWLNSDSELAAEIGDRPNRFYVDLELVAAGLNPLLGTSFYKLTEDWHDHKAGSLVMETYEGVEEEPPSFTFAVVAVEVTT